MGTGDQYTFVQVPIKKQDTKDRELDISRIKSHASRAVFRSRPQPRKNSRTLSGSQQPLSKQQTSNDSKDGGAHGGKPRDAVVSTVKRRHDQILRDSAWQWGHGFRSDAFNIFSGGRGSGSAIAIDFVLQHGSPIMSALAASFGVPDIYGRWLFEQMASFKDVYHSIVAIALRSYGFLTGTIGTGATNVQLHKTIAISTLRARLAQPGATADDAAILTMVLLALFEEGGGNRREFRIHARQVKAMLKSRGGVSGLQADTGTKAAVAQFHAHTADVYPSSQPISSTYPWRPVSAAFLNALDQIPSGFRKLALAGRLSDHLVQMIQTTAGTTYKKAASNVSLSNHRIPSTSYSRDYQDEGQALTIPNSGDGPSFERAITQGLIRYRINSAVNSRPRQCLSHCLNMELLRYLPSMTIPVEGIRRTSLQWVWLMVIDSWCFEAGVLSPEGVVLLNVFRDKFPETVYWTPEDFNALGSRFFWTKSISKIIRACWGKPFEIAKKTPISLEIEELPALQAVPAGYG